MILCEWAKSKPRKGADQPHGHKPVRARISLRGRCTISAARLDRLVDHAVPYAYHVLGLNVAVAVVVASQDLI